MALFKDLPKVMKAALAVLAAVILCEAVYVLAKGTAKKAESIKTLKVEGLTLCADGEPVVFKGVSLGWHNIWPRFYNSGTVKSLHDDWGVEIFRAAIGADSHAKADNPDCLGGYIDDPQTALKCAFKVIDAAIQNKAYVIVDWHSHILHPEEAADFFGKVASKYAGVPNVIYELFNEPVCRSFEDCFSYSDLGDPEAMAAYWDELKEYAEKLIKVITDADPSHPLVLMGNPCWDQRPDLVAANPVDYDNIMYTVHFYAASHKEELRAVSDSALAAGVPLFISECASCENTGNGRIDEQSWNEWNEWASERNISMLCWSISDKDETCSMFKPEASSAGPWDDSVIKPWGLTVKEWLK